MIIIIIHSLKCIEIFNVVQGWTQYKMGHNARAKQDQYVIKTFTWVDSKAYMHSEG